MNYLDFNSRDTYLVMRKQWSADFQAGIKRIRAAKNGIKEAMRAGDFTWKAYAELRKAHENLSDLHSELYAMKAEANRQYHAKKAA